MSLKLDQIPETDRDARRRIAMAPELLKPALLELYWAMLRNEANPRAQGAERAFRKHKADEELERLELVTSKALAGKYGQRVQGAAQSLLAGEPDRAELWHAYREINKLRVQCRDGDDHGR